MCLAGVCCAVWTVAATQGTQPPPVGQPVFQITRAPVVDAAAEAKGKALWAVHCIDCHGSNARGSEKGPNIIRTRTVNFDRSAQHVGSVLGPFLMAGHPTQSGKGSASFTNDEVVALANFLRQRVNDTMRSSPLFTAGDIVVGNARAGEAFFKGPGGCTSCHNDTTRNLAGIMSRIPSPVDVQQRMLFPGGRGRGGRGRGAPAGPPPPNPNATTVTVTPASGAALSGVLVEESDFHVSLREPDGTIRVVRKGPGAKVTKTNPLQGHIDLLDRITDTQIRDLVAYLVTLK